MIARAISSLNHPNVCALYDIGHQDGIDYLVMEFLDGETLAQRLAKGPLPPEQVLKYGIEICEGLGEAGGDADPRKPKEGAVARLTASLASILSS